MPQQFKDLFQSELRQEQADLQADVQTATHEPITSSDYGPHYRLCESLNRLNDEVERRDVTPPPARNARTEVYSTPAKNSFFQTVTDNGTVVNDVLKQHLQVLLHPRLHRDMPVVEFIQRIYNFDPENIPHKLYLLPRAHCSHFYQAQSERASYGPLQAIFANLKEQLYGNGDMLPLDSNTFCLRDTIVEGNYAVFKPDFFCTTHSPSGPWKRQQWNNALVSGEVKRSDKLHERLPREYEESDVINLDMLLNCPTTPTPSKVQLNQRTNAMLIPTHVPVRTSSKRKSESTLVGRSSKRHRSSRASCTSLNKNESGVSSHVRSLTGNELQAVEYINELISHGARSFATGWLLEDTQMSLWYIDRMGVVQSTRFDIFKESHYLLLLIAAISSASLHDIGVCHLIKADPNSKTFETWDDMTLELHNASSDTTKILPELNFKVTDRGDIYTDYGGVGRGTTIIPIRPIGDTAQLLDLNDEERLVAKIAWPPAYRDSEGNFVKKIRQCLTNAGNSHILKHIVDIKCSLSHTMGDAKLPRAFMDLEKPAGCEERIFRCFVMTRYDRLENVNSVDEFKQVFIDVVRAHHRVYKTSNILHRDISAGNVMFRRRDGQVMGILCDWDLAYDSNDPRNALDEKIVITKPEETQSESGDKVEAPDGPAAVTATEGKDSSETEKAEDSEARPRPRYRTGTGPFMACEMLGKGEVPPHIYRFDLESFFWLLAWFCTVFDSKQHAYVRSAYWEHPDLYTTGEKKRSFIEDFEIFNLSLQDSDPEYRSLSTSWVNRLCGYFQIVINHRNKVVNLSTSVSRAQLSGDKTGETISLNKLQKAQEEGKDIVTYEGFMEVLGIKKDDM